MVDGQLRLVNGAAGRRPARADRGGQTARRRRAADGRRPAMSVELCIRRPVMTILVMASFIIAGRLRLQAASRRGHAARRLPDHPGARRQLPGASPETMASSVAVDPRAPVLDHRRRHVDDLDVVARQHLDRRCSSTSTATSTAPRSTCSRRSPRRCGACRPTDDAAQLPQGQSGRLRRSCSWR